MKAKVDRVKLQMTIEEAVSLKEEIRAMINEICQADITFCGYFDEPALREKYQCLNELLCVLNIREALPF